VPAGTRVSAAATILRGAVTTAPAAYDHTKPKNPGSPTTHEALRDGVY
jgi:hypothetical protein